jgi:hypothetical protein
LIGFSSGDLLGIAINVSTLGWPFGPVCRRGLTHVGIVAADAADRPALWEATTLCDFSCLYCGRIHDGLQSHGPMTRIKNYRGAVWHYPLRLPLDDIEKKQLFRYAEKFHGQSYDYEGAAQSRSLCLGWLFRRSRRENLSSLFCSEFAAAAWEAAEVWDTPNVSAWNPNRLAKVAVAVGLVGEPGRLR